MYFSNFRGANAQGLYLMTSSIDCRFQIYDTPSSTRPVEAHMNRFSVLLLVNPRVKEVFHHLLLDLLIGRSFLGFRSDL